MNESWTLRQEHEDGAPRLRLSPGPGQAERRVCTSAEAAKLLGRSGRQVYRFIKEQRVASYGKFLGEWLLDLADVERLARRPAKPQRLPSRFQTFFPEHAVADLNPGRDRHLVLSRLMESGGTREIRWLRRRYQPEELASFITEDGARLLSPRPLRFWAGFLGIPVPQGPSWRKPLWRPGANT
ncbi:MAG: hypothetical protein WC943_09545 [Elusimicrobiota bacterium]|jgi:hypothetical protein